MNVSLNPHFEDFVSKQLEGGRYNNASEVIRAGLRLLEEQELKVQELRREIDKGYKGEPVEFSAQEIKEMGRSLKS
ncbi:MAG: type II toxin-antitoxin system ParD family antitoxin [Cytophagales bacterium]|nr:type II toxin-antitoxin system ParD family antitoxin [Cytophagales bacterium]